MSSGGTQHLEEQLRGALDSVAGEIRTEPGAYRRARASWRRRERRRRFRLALLIAVVFAAVDALGLWALSHVDAQTHVIFSESTQVDQGPVSTLGQP